MKTSELNGAALDWAVAVCEDHFANRVARITNGRVDVDYFESWSPSTDWALAGPIIERERITLRNYKPALWDASIGRLDYVGDGETPLIAAMRCYVASKLGDEIQIPETLK